MVDQENSVAYDRGSIDDFPGNVWGKFAFNRSPGCSAPTNKNQMHEICKNLFQASGFSTHLRCSARFALAESALLKGRLSQLTCMKPFDWSMQHNDADAPAPLSRELRETIKGRCGRHKLSFSRKTLLVNLRIRAFLLFFYILFHSSNHHGKRVLYFFPKILV